MLAAVTLGDTSKDDFDKDTGLPADFFDKTLAQSVTRSTQAWPPAPAALKTRDCRTVSGGLKPCPAVVADRRNKSPTRRCYRST